MDRLAAVLMIVGLLLLLSIGKSSDSSTHINLCFFCTYERHERSEYEQPTDDAHREPRQHQPKPRQDSPNYQL